MASEASGSRGGGNVKPTHHKCREDVDIKPQDQIGVLGLDLAGVDLGDEPPAARFPMSVEVAACLAMLGVEAHHPCIVGLQHFTLETVCV